MSNTDQNIESTWIDLSRAEDLRDVIHQAVACLAQGGIVGLPSETAYCLAASALKPKAVERLNVTAEDKNRTPRDSSGLFPPQMMLGLRCSAELADWVPELSELAERIARRAWPGPVTLLIECKSKPELVEHLASEVQSLVASDRTIALCVPSHDIVLEILRLLPGPMVLRKLTSPESVSGCGSTAEVLRGLPDVDLVLDDGPTQFGGENAMIKLEDEACQLISPGPLDENALSRLSGRMILFVCMGNTCRSPMAEAIAKHLLAKKLACTADELESRGIIVKSAGLAACQGARAASEAIDVIHARGGSLKKHASQPVSPQLIAQADWILGMTRDHLTTLIEEFPDAADRIFLLDPNGEDVADPIGTDRKTYQQTADRIETHLKVILSRFGLLVD